MKVSADGFDFDFTDAVDAFVFDEKDPASPQFHGLSHAMKAVDVVVELPMDYLFVEAKTFQGPDDYTKDKAFDHLRERLKYKYRDTFLYRWAEEKVDKPIRYICLLTLDNALISRMNKELQRQLPPGKAARWKKEIAGSCVVVNPERWNRNFPRWPVTCPGDGGAAVAAGPVP